MSMRAAVKEGQEDLASAKALHDLVRLAHPNLPHDPCHLCDKETDVDQISKSEHEAAVQAAVDAANAAAEQRIAAAVAEATGPLQAQLEQLQAAAGATEIDQAVAAATADFQTQLDAQKTELETVQANLAAVTQERDDLAAAVAAEVEEKEKGERKEARVAAVKDLREGDAWAAFADEHGDDWADLEDTVWDAKLEELTKLQDAMGEPAGPPTRRSALTATAPGADPKKTASPASQLIRRQRELQTTGSAGN